MKVWLRCCVEWVVFFFLNCRHSTLLHFVSCGCVNCWSSAEGDVGKFDVETHLGGFWLRGRFVKTLFIAMFLRGKLTNIVTCAWMLPYMVSDCSMSRSGRNDDEFLVFRSRGPIRTVKFREVYLSVGDCNAVHWPEKSLEFTRCCLIVRAKSLAGASTEKNHSVILSSCEAEIEENMSTRREENSGLPNSFS